MPKVPMYDSFQATPNALPQTQLQGAALAPNPVGTPDVAGQQAQQAGQAMQRFGGDAGRIALDMAQQANQLRVDDALNQAKEAALNLTYNKDTGFTNLKGINALDRPDGKPLADEYSDSLKKHIDKIAGGLGNQVQRQLFAVHANDILTSMHGQAMKHESQEYQTYALSVSDGVQSTAMRDISLNWNNPDAVGSAVERIKAETYRQAQLLGKSAEWQEAQARKLTSGAHKTALMAALQQNDPTYADAYLKKFSDQMEADDILAVRGHVTKDMDLRVAGAAAADVLGRYSTRINPGEATRAFNIALGTESNGKQFAPDGKPLTSPKGAIGIAQVMPDTAPEAAKLAGLPWDENRYKNDLEYNKALGKAYFEKQLQTNGGDLPKAYAAYNAGPGALQAATKQAEVDAKKTTDGPVKTWLAYLPAETQNYVAKNMREFGAGLGNAPRPTLAELKSDLQRDPTLANNPARLKSAETVLESRFRDNEAARKQTEDDATDKVLRELYANGGRLDAVPAELRSALPGDKLGTVMEFATKVAKNGSAVQTPEAWASVLSLPREQLAALTPLDFYKQFRPVLDDEHLEKGYALLAAAHGSASDKHLEIISTTSRVKQAAITSGMIPEKGTPDKAQLTTFSQFERSVDEQVRQFEKVDLAGKRKANGDELQKIIDHTMINKAFAANSWWFDKEMPVSTMKPGELATAYVKVGGKEIHLASIPTTQRATIASKLQARGIPVSEQRIAELWEAAGRPK